eukprot:TRINITY_DN21614_c0_g1_i1.p1 TRINITY_DN21614_c0_g1~~TRINITY_DN21614_c0_g1_i1.p1  ORF type:complete len:262 (-),score=57.94 TRINITY_DN21614_c0_g1_i1:42-827(-)
MAITASLIARGNVVLAEYYPPGTTFPTIARRLIEQIPSSPDSKKSYSYESYNFHYLVEGGITYICMSDQNIGYRIPYAFLFDLNSRFKSMYGQTVHTAPPMFMTDTFSRTMRDRMDFFSHDPNADKISKVKGDIDEVKRTMATNIEKVLERGEKIEVLVDKTDTLNQQAQSFKKKGTQLKRKMWWKNAKLCCCLIIIGVLLIGGVTVGLLAYFGVFGDLGGIMHHKSTESSSYTASHVVTRTLTHTITYDPSSTDTIPSSQ